MLKSIIKNKREAKELRKIHEEMFDIYIQKMNAVEYVTAQACAKMISEFVMFSPGIDPNDLELFLISKFNILKSGGSLILNLIGTPLKYYR